MQQGYSLGSLDLKKIGIGLLVAEAGAILAQGLVWLQMGTFDWKTLLLLEEAAVLGTLVNTLRKVLDGQVNAQ